MSDRIEVNTRTRWSFGVLKFPDPELGIPAVVRVELVAHDAIPDRPGSPWSTPIEPFEVVRDATGHTLADAITRGSDDAVAEFRAVVERRWDDVGFDYERRVVDDVDVVGILEKLVRQAHDELTSTTRRRVRPVVVALLAALVLVLVLVM